MDSRIIMKMPQQEGFIIRVFMILSQNDSVKIPRKPGFHQGSRSILFAIPLRPSRLCGKSSVCQHFTR